MSHVNPRVYSPEMADPVLLVHGGAWAIPDELLQPHLSGVTAALRAGWRVLEAGGSAIEAVETAVVLLEDDETFDAGRGSFLNADGRVQLDAVMMDGATLEAGGVGCVERIRTPIRAARVVLERSPHLYFVGEGAERFATAHHVPLCDNRDLIVEREVVRLQRHRTSGSDQFGRAGSPPAGAGSRPSAEHGRGVRAPEDRSHDTVGAIALDAGGNLAAGNSTGGTLDKAPGRIGDSSLIGCGCYADNLTAAALCTGWGEPVMKLVLAKWGADRVGAGTAPAQAADDAIAYLDRRVQGRAGILLLDSRGRYGVAHNTARMAWGIKSVREERVNG